MKNIRLIHEVHDMWPATLIEIGGMKKSNLFVKIMQKAEDSAYINSDFVVSILPYAKEYMVQHGLKEEKFINIPNGIVEIDWENAEAIPQEIKEKLSELKKMGKFIVGYFGGHALSNALDVLLDVAKRMENNNEIRFVLVGNGIEKERLIKRVKNENINNIIFFDAIRKKAIPNLLKWFDCIYIGTIYSSLYRFGLGMNKIYDAMMAGKPIILSATTPRTIVEQFNAGVVVPASDIGRIVKAINKIYRMTPRERRKLGKNGQEAVKKYFTYNKLAEDFEKIIGQERKKRILLINHYAGSPEMGMEFRPYYFAKEWVKLGHRVDILAADFSHLRVRNPIVKYDLETEVIDGIYYHWIHTGVYKKNGIKRALTMFEFVFKILLNAKKIVKNYNPDVIITSSTYPLDTYVGQRLRKLV